MKKLTPIILTILILNACETNTPLKQGVKNQIEDKKLAKTEIEAPVEAPPIVYLNDFEQYHKKRSSSFQYPNTERIINSKKKFDFEILIPSIYHATEINPRIKKLKWQGLFKDQNDFYLDDVNLKLSLVHDQLFDDEDQKTGTEVSIKGNKKECLLLFQSSDSLHKGSLNHVPFGNYQRKKEDIPRTYIIPEEPVSFTFNNKSYTLFSAASKFEEFEGYFEAKHYQLYIGIGDEPYLHNQLLSFDVDLSGDDLPILSIDFIGDLDGDQMPDFILDNSSKYKFLYLSKNAETGKLVKLAAVFPYWFGC